MATLLQATMKGEPSQVAVAESERRVKSVDKVITLLGAFHESRPYITLSEAAALLGIHKSSASRLLRQLAHEGLLTRDPNGHRYGIGIRLFEIGNLYIHSNELVTLSHEYLEGLVGATGQTAQLCLRDGYESVVVASIESRLLVKAAANLGGRLPLHCSASGHMLLTDLSDEEIVSLYKIGPLAHIAAEIDIEALVGYVQEARRKRLSVVIGEYRPELLAVAAPICAVGGHLRAVICLVAPYTQEALARMGEYEEATRATAEDFSRRLGG